MKVLGIDEAGRGSVIGPMCIGGVMIEEKDEKKLKDIGVKDSKLLKREKREELSEKIEGIAENCVVIRISPCKIDSNKRSGGNLNQLEAMRMADIINLTKPDKAIIDCPDNGGHKFRDYLMSYLEHKDFELVLENKADLNYPVVSAASIMAKVSRDDSMTELEEELGEKLGVGYPHDKYTIAHLERIAEENNGKMPSYVRTTWDTVNRICAKYKQNSLSSFLGKLKK